ncbi:hypothetical protein MIMGU_mgv1a0149541mg, partial [Erythranthe guttata]
VEFYNARNAWDAE